MRPAMFPFRTSSIFRSRWIALLWAGGIIWTAVEFAGSADRHQGLDANGIEEAPAAVPATGSGR